MPVFEAPVIDGKSGEQKHQFLVLKKFRSLNTQPSREALAEDEFAWLENCMPIGDGFMKAVPQIGAAIATVTSNIVAMHPATLGTVNYQINFTSAGGAQAVNLANSSVVTITGGGTFTGTPAMDQWKSERIMIADTSGMYSWDGTLFHPPGSLATITVIAGGSGYTSTPAVTFTGGGGSNATAVATLASSSVISITITAPGSGFTAAPAVGFTGGGGSNTTASAYIMPSAMGGDAIATFSGRVFVANGRLLSYTAPNTWYNVSTADAAGSTTITEGSLRQKIFGMEALDNYLYVFGDSSIIVIGDLKVTGAVTTFSQTFLSSTTGTTLPNSITSLERAIIFANKYGVYALYGASVQKVSKALDGLFPRIDFSQPVTAGLAQIYNILCYGVSFTYQDANSNRPLQALLFDGKWFLTSQGSLTRVAPASVNGVLSLWGTTGRDLRQLYSDTTATIATTAITGLYDLGNPIFDKQVIHSGIEYTAPAQSTLVFQIDTEQATVQQNATGGNTLTWYNNSGQEITWVNNSNNEITWIITGFLLDHFPTSITGKYLGATVTSNSPGVVINGMLVEFEKRAPW